MRVRDPTTDCRSNSPRSLTSSSLIHYCTLKRYARGTEGQALEVAKVTALPLPVSDTSPYDWHMCLTPYSGSGTDEALPLLELELASSFAFRITRRIEPTLVPRYLSRTYGGASNAERWSSCVGRVRMANGCCEGCAV